MASVNMLIIVGHLGADPDLRTAGQTPVCQFSVATNESWKGKDGEKKERVEWTTVVAWGKLGEVCAKYLKKGREVYVKGRKQTRSYDDKEGVKRYAVELVAEEVQFLGSGGGGEDSGSRNSSKPPPPAPPSVDDDIPF